MVLRIASLDTAKPAGSPGTFGLERRNTTVLQEGIRHEGRKPGTPPSPLKNWGANSTKSNEINKCCSRMGKNEPKTNPICLDLDRIFARFDRKIADFFFEIAKSVLNPAETNRKVLSARPMTCAMMPWRNWLQFCHLPAV